MTIDDGVYCILPNLIGKLLCGQALTTKTVKPLWMLAVLRVTNEHNALFPSYRLNRILGHGASRGNLLFNHSLPFIDSMLPFGARCHIPIDADTKIQNKDKHLPTGSVGLYILNMRFTHGVSVVSPLIDCLGDLVMRAHDGQLLICGEIAKSVLPDVPLPIPHQATGNQNRAYWR